MRWSFKIKTTFVPSYFLPSSLWLPPLTPVFKTLLKSLSFSMGRSIKMHITKKRQRVQSHTWKLILICLRMQICIIIGSRDFEALFWTELKGQRRQFALQEMRNLDDIMSYQRQFMRAWLIWRWPDITSSFVFMPPHKSISTFAQPF